MKYNSMKNTSNNNRAAEFKYLLYQRRIKQNKIKNFINFTFKKYDIKILIHPSHCHSKLNQIPFILRKTIC